tara:strand:+ start:1104 stop:1331 length:228 start_codon:yes stop_codon:yes gene_type:complete
MSSCSTPSADCKLYAGEAFRLPIDDCPIVKRLKDMTTPVGWAVAGLLKFGTPIGGIGAELTEKFDWDGHVSYAHA